MKKILIANRGEIALRIIRSAKELGIGTVAIYSEADRGGLHVRHADEAVCIGPPPSADSYLQGEKIIKICKEVKADAIHPGYGFLAENANFADMVTKAGLIFIGPSPESIRVMGDKLAAKAAVSKYNIPMVPGMDKAITNIEEANEAAKKIGFPILIKAAAGGGGKGMRIVEKPDELKENMERAISESKSAFGDGSVFIEKYISSPRHIEVQILGDDHGNIIHLFERECSIQRRHQKVVEESPSAIISPKMREEMGKSAVEVARACDYSGAGTVEFLVDEKMNYYFLEMNTRLQVEHPVTELITGTDLVKEQIKIADGEVMTLTQKDLKINGHAIELRVYAEDPYHDFLPDAGMITHYENPQGVGVRVDDGYNTNMEIPVYYDSLISKLITYGKDREEALQRMRRGIKEYTISGVKTTLPFGEFVMNHKAFISGKFDTHFVATHFQDQPTIGDELEEGMIAGLVASKLLDSKTTLEPMSKPDIADNNWTRRKYIE